MRGIKTLSDLTSYSAIQTVNLKDKVASLQNTLSDWGRRTEKLILISQEECSSLKELQVRSKRSAEKEEGKSSGLPFF